MNLLKSEIKIDSKIFENTQIAFQNKSDKDLKRAYWLFRIIANNFLTKIGPFITILSLKMQLPIKGLIRTTIFKQFCGGESIEDCDSVIENLYSQNVGAILDYSAEGDSKGFSYEKTTSEILKTIEKAKNNSSIPFTVFKPSGMGKFSLYEKLSEKALLTDKENSEATNLVNRIEVTCRVAFEKNVRILIDAEHTWIQPAIDELVLDNMQKFNKERAVVFNTYQLYRNDKLDSLREDIEFAKSHHFVLGVKLVRGAYMETERKRAREKGYPSPIYDDKISTDKAFNQAILLCLDNLQNVSFMAGTHNEDSSALLVAEMKKRGLNPNDKRIFFAQLYGMSDHISFNLAHLGYNVAKYLPYGALREVMPYLFRRAKENTSIGGQAGRELTLLTREMKRRKLKP